MQITFKDGTKAKLETGLNIKKLMMINRDFNTDDVVTLSFNESGGQTFNLLTAVKAVYVAYRQANMNDYISYDSFLDLWKVNMTFAAEVYSKIMEDKVKKSNFQEGFKGKK
ncbi:hypothetical protein LABALGNA3A7_09800 [Dellaglioa algida]|nr:hypothetical protein LABALGNA3A7_09800 [Dellaglioa algida]